jgi:Squalene-hopene cyclase C-terminal domain
MNIRPDNFAVGCVKTKNESRTHHRTDGYVQHGVSASRGLVSRHTLHPLLAFAVFAAITPTVFSDEPTVTQTELRASVEKSIPLITKGAVGHREQRTCFACHNQGTPILALTTARAHGFAVDEEELGRQYKFIQAFLSGNREQYLLGKGQGGQADTAGSALLTLELGKWKPDETTNAVAEYLLLYQADSDHWSGASSRPPSEGSPFTTTFVSLRGLAAFATEAQKERGAIRKKQAGEWLLKATAKDNEDRVFRLWGLHAAGVKSEEIEAAAKELVSKQRKDGGWTQIDAPFESNREGDKTETFEPNSDAYATGSALVGLHLAGEMKTTDQVYQRGLAFLLKSQLADGSWHIKSRSKPFQKYFETGFPHEKDQFISSAATSWAVTAMALACEKPTSQ